MKHFLFIGFFATWSLLGWSQEYADHSVLSSGKWIRIPIAQDGAYALDAAFLRNAGFEPNQIDPRNIQMFGRPGGMLPQENARSRPDDLPEISIEVTGEADGSFDANDRVLFYAQGPHGMRYLSESEQHEHEFNLYADTSYYYLRVGQEPGKRILTAADPGPATYTSTQHREVYYHERDFENLIKSGRLWLGEKFDSPVLDRTFSFPLFAAHPDGLVRIRFHVVARSDVNTSFQASIGNNVLGNVQVGKVNIGSTENTRYNRGTGSFLVPVSALSTTDSIRVKLAFDRSGSSLSEGWLDWIEVEYDAQYDTRGRQIAVFRMADKISSAGQVAGLSIAGMNSTYRLWDVRDPLHPQSIPYSLNGNVAQLALSAETAATTLLAFSAPMPVALSFEPVKNQDLHGLPIVDYLIISGAQFRAEAQRLATFHETFYGRSTAVVTPEEIYHEFSGGRQDVTAIRDFIRMFWVRSSGVAPGYVNMFGDGTYIYKYVRPNFDNSTNYVPTYQSRNSWLPPSSFTSDDFFVLLEDHEGFWGEASGIFGDGTAEINTLDAAIGRLPIENVEQAKIIVDKIINYVTNPDAQYFGDWRSRIVLVADHKEGEGSLHVKAANDMDAFIKNADPSYNVDKIYMDNYPLIPQNGLTRFPAGRTALLEAFDAGSLILNYSGHGGETAWSEGKILENSDIPQMKNKFRTPAVITATCEFGRYDDPVVRSGAELLTMAPEVGAIALFTTVRLVYTTGNRVLNENFYREVFRFDSLAGRMPTVGEVMMRTKNTSFRLANINSRNFTLLGDPGLTLNYPRYRARITHFNGEPIVEGELDSLRSLGRVEVEGIIENELGVALPSFQGEMDVTVFDKPNVFVTRLSKFPFSWQKNRIFSGKATVENGTFRFSFVVPIDISYEDGQGKISLYFHDASTDGAGYYDNLYIGGTDNDAVLDTEGPQVQLYINDEQWVHGGITDANPYLYARVFDENGINTAGAGIGHEISAVLDEAESNILILNDFYEADVNNYKSGTIRYLLRDLSLGEHTLRIRVWDVANNPSEAETRFIVTDDARMALDQILNYPNPMADNTTFLVGHNQAGYNLDLEIDIVTVDGRLVKNIRTEFVAGGNVNRDLSWDGKHENGSPVSDGLYIYQVRLRNADTGQEVHAARRLVLVKP